MIEVGDGLAHQPVVARARAELDLDRELGAVGATTERRAHDVVEQRAQGGEPLGVFARPVKPKRSWRNWLFTVDHKKIGIMYGTAAMFFFLIGGIEALLIRLQLATPNGKNNGYSIETSFMLDITGSMNDNNKIADMKVACKRGDLRTKAYRTESEGREANIMKLQPFLLRARVLPAPAAPHHRLLVSTARPRHAYVTDSARRYADSKRK